MLMVELNKKGWARKNSRYGPVKQIMAGLFCSCKNLKSGDNLLINAFAYLTYSSQALVKSITNGLRQKNIFEHLCKEKMSDEVMCPQDRLIDLMWRQLEPQNGAHLPSKHIFLQFTIIEKLPQNDYWVQFCNSILKPATFFIILLI